MKRPHFLPVASARSRIRGATLISLMVGLTISMLAVASMMLVLSNMTKTTAEARTEAQYDDSLGSALLSAGLVFHDAGFGVTKARLGTHLIIATGASLVGTELKGTPVTTGSARSGNLVVWQQKTGTDLQCSGLLVREVDKGNGQKEYTLMRLAPVECTSLTLWTSVPWTASAVTRARIGPAITITATELSGTGACAPFGIGAATGYMRISVSANNSNGIALSSAECIYNFADPSAP